MNRHINHLFIFCLAFLALSTVILRGAEPLNDGDIWFHIAYGRYLLENHTLIPDHSVFSWTPATNGIIYCAWFSEIIFYLLYEAGGLPMLYAFRYLVIGMFIVLAVSLLKRSRLALSPVTMLILMTGILMSYAGLRIKAELFSFLFMTVFVWTWFTIKARPDKNWILLYFFPAILFLWANSHGGFILGLVFLAFMGVGELLNYIAGSSRLLTPRFRKHLFIALCLCFLSIFLTPYGLQYIAQLGNDLILNPEEFKNHMKTIAEYQSIFFPQASHFHFKDYLVVAAMIFSSLAAIQFKKNKIDWAILLVNIGFILLYIKYIRATYFWGIIFVFSSFFIIREISQSRSKEYTENFARLSVSCLAGIIVIFFGLRAHFQAFTMPSIGFNQDYIIPAAETEYVRKNCPGLVIGNDYYCGSYLLWSLWPTRKVFIDARYFPYKQWYHEYYEFAWSPDKKLDDLFLSKYRADIWILAYDTPVLNYFVSSPDWRLVYYGSSACVFISRSIPFDQRTHLVSDSVYNTGIYHAYKILKFAASIGDSDVATRIARAMKPNPICELQKEFAINAKIYAGSRLSENGRNYEAIEIFNDALDISSRFKITGVLSGKRDNKDITLLHDNLGYSLMKANRISEAIREYNQALRLNPSANHAQKFLPLLEEQMKKIDSALTRLKYELVNKPDNVSILNTLTILSSMKERYDETLTYLNRLLEIKPNDPNIYYNIACIYARQKKVDDSVEYLRIAVNKGFNDWNTLDSDPDLANLRHTPYFAQLTSDHLTDLDIQP